MGKKNPELWDEAINPIPDGPDLTVSAWEDYKQDYSGTKALGYDKWKNQQRSLFDTVPFEPPVYTQKEFPQLPVTPSVPSGAPAPTAPKGQAPNPQVINRYLEQVMSKVGGEGSGQTEVGKALRAKSSGGEK